MTPDALWAIVYGLGLVIFVNRYVAGLLVRAIRGRSWDETRDDFEPRVTAVVPMFNEAAAIAATLRGVLASSYPAAKLRVVCVDDGSTDASYARACAIAAAAGDRLTVLRNPVNQGKRRSLIRAVRAADGEVVVSIDSDVVVAPDAIRQLVRRFTDDRIAAVGGCVEVGNLHANWLTRMQGVKYWYGYHFLKNLEWSFRRVLCLSGCLTAYRRDVLLALEPTLARRAILGVPITYGEDRFLTRQLVKAGYLTTMTLDARCATLVPSTLGAYLGQQLRWRRSNLVDYAGAVSHVWRLNPILAIHFFSLCALLVIYPLALVRAVGSFRLFPMLALHAAILVGFGALYRWRTRARPAAERVGPLALAPLTLLMPITYGLLTPLALFTLDAASWETRPTPAAGAAALTPRRSRGPSRTSRRGTTTRPRPARSRWRPPRSRR